MTDKIIAFGASLIQHGRHSNRAYLMHLADGDDPGEVSAFLDELATVGGYTKIFAKVPESARDDFAGRGYRVEATVPGLYQGAKTVCFMGKYLCPDRRQERRPELVSQALALAFAKASAPSAPQLAAALESRLTAPDDAPAMARLYRQVFATYPFPIHDPDYLCETMASHVIYRGVWSGGELVALASAETDAPGQNAEMTDFATLPAWQGQGLAGYLLGELEAEAADRGIRTAYTIARSYSVGMNVTFARQGYSFCGTLTQNTQISGDLESMNVWHKALAAEPGP